MSIGLPNLLKKVFSLLLRILLTLSENRCKWFQILETNYALLRTNYIHTIIMTFKTTTTKLSHATRRWHFKNSNHNSTTYYHSKFWWSVCSDNESKNFHSQAFWLKRAECDGDESYCNINIWKIKIGKFLRHRL